MPRKEVAYRDDKIRARMAAERITQEQLAARAGLTRQTINAIANGKVANVQLPTLQAIADALGLKLAELFDREAA
ncbi:MAG TPA: helix-turn-helix transcriptional regulator [Blastocatellia bacterium]|nr:helix-turn-helix transcriptional regulator [Blastocatellia bacterium]